MAMDGTKLGKAIAAAILDPTAGASAKADCEAIWIKISNEIVKHIQTEAKVQPGITTKTPFSPSPLPGVTDSEGVIL